MNFKIRKQYDHILLSEHENGAIMVRALNGAYITVIDSTWNGYKKQLEKIDYLQGQRMRAQGIK